MLLSESKLPLANDCILLSYKDLKIKVFSYYTIGNGYMHNQACHTYRRLKLWRSLNASFRTHDMSLALSNLKRKGRKRQCNEMLKCRQFTYKSCNEISP